MRGEPHSCMYAVDLAVEILELWIDGGVTADILPSFGVTREDFRWRAVYDEHLATGGVEETVILRIIFGFVAIEVYAADR